ncbi:hypothetical protein D3C86_2076920 [compost metagenome]
MESVANVLSIVQAVQLPMENAVHARNVTTPGPVLKRLLLCAAGRTLLFKKMTA